MIMQELGGYISTLEKVRLRDGLKHILNISRHGNGFLQATEPWKLVRGTDGERALAGTAIGVCANITCLLSVLLQPYMPVISKDLQKQLKAPAECNIICEKIYQLLPPGHKIGVPSPIFTKIEPDFLQSLKKKYGSASK